MGGLGLENRIGGYDLASAPRSTEVPKHYRNGRFPGSRVILPAAPSQFTQWLFAAFITCYSCGTAKELHPLPFYPCLEGHGTKTVW